MNYVLEVAFSEQLEECWFPSPQAGHKNKRIPTAKGKKQNHTHHNSVVVLHRVSFLRIIPIPMLQGDFYSVNLIMQ